jgi:ABC-type transport system involved in multi-copper enzyme maturation permease subunit
VLPLLIGKEFRDLLASRAFWLLLLMVGPLVGHAFITAVESYAEASGSAGGPAALAQGLSPLDGVLVPTFGTYDIAVTLLFPFVAIRLISGERSSGAWKLMLQSPARMGTALLAKALTLLAGWTIAWIPGLLALILWKSYGGSLYAPEVGNLLLGHLLRLVLASGVAVAAAAIANGAASAAIVTLGFTVGTWALDFVAAGRGGLLARIAAYTPTAALRVFEQGQLRLATVLILLLIGIGGFCVAAVWLQPGGRLGRHILQTAILVFAFAGLMWNASHLRAAWDLSENRRNSFPAPDEAALRQIRAPLRVTVNLAPEDPRLMDLDRNILSKLERLLPSVEVNYTARSHSGLFEGDHYGEVWYEMSGRRVMSRSTTEPIVLDTIYELAAVPKPPPSPAADYAGHPLTASPRAAALMFYAVWPILTILCALLETAHSALQ